MFCSFCGIPNSDDANFCRECGRQLREEPDNSEKHGLEELEENLLDQAQPDSDPVQSPIEELRKSVHIDGAGFETYEAYLYDTHTEQTTGNGKKDGTVAHVNTEKPVSEPDTDASDMQRYFGSDMAQRILAFSQSGGMDIFSSDGADKMMPDGRRDDGKAGSDAAVGADGLKYTGITEIENIDADVLEMDVRTRETQPPDSAGTVDSGEPASAEPNANSPEPEGSGDLRSEESKEYGNDRLRDGQAAYGWPENPQNYGGTEPSQSGHGASDDTAPLEPYDQGGAKETVGKRKKWPIVSALVAAVAIVAIVGSAVYMAVYHPEYVDAVKEGISRIIAPGEDETAGGGETENTPGAGVETELPTDESGEALPVYGAGETVDIMDGTAIVGRLTINSAEVTYERNEQIAAEPSTVVIVDYTYENLADGDDMYISNMNLVVTSNKGERGEYYPLDAAEYPKRIEANSICYAEEPFSFTDSAETVRIEYYYDTSDSQPQLVFEVEVDAGSR